MKRLIILLISIGFFFVGCDFNHNVKGWYVDNKSEQQIIIKFGNDTVTAPAKVGTYFEDIDENANVVIADDYHVNYDISYKYSTSSHNSKLLTIKDKTKYKYLIQNSTEVEITFYVGDVVHTLAKGAQEELVFYDEPYTFTFTSDGFSYNYTTNLSDGVYHIRIVSSSI